MIIPVSGLGDVGLVTDAPAHELSPKAWTRGQNIRFLNGAVEKFTGHAETYPTPVCAPYWLLNVPGFWLYAGLTKVGATDGTSHADITRAVGGDYTADAISSWTGTTIEDIPVISNGADAPQMWTPVALAQKLQVLTAWPAATLCQSMRSLKRYLVALNVTKGAVLHPNMIKWSDQAPTGGVPTSWDETDETRDAGEYTLPSEGGDTLDMFPLRDDGIIYKNEQTWRMSYVAGIDVFRFVRIFSSIGSVGKRCAAEYFSGKHIVYTGDDLVMHDGAQAQSILDTKTKSLITATVDTTRFAQAFVVVDYKQKEVWCGFTETGYTLPNKAVVWDWNTNAVGVRDLPAAAFIASGRVSPGTDLWSSSTDPWSTDTRVWGDTKPNANERNLLIAAPAVTKLFIADNTQQFDGVNFTSLVERTGIGFPLKVGDPPDITTEKMVRGIWPRITGTAGGVINVYIGSQQEIDGIVTWSPALPFTIGISKFVDRLMTGRLHALRFESTTNISWRLSGYEVDVVAVGSRGS